MKSNLIIQFLLSLNLLFFSFQFHGQEFQYSDPEDEGFSKERLERIAPVIQKYIDHSISSTINLPEDVEPEVISDIYFMAWQKNLKGVTIYRDGSRFPILSVDNKLTAFQQYKDKKFEIVNDEGNTIEVRGDHVLKTETGRLTTLYHYMNNSNNHSHKTANAKQTEEVKNV